MARLRLWPGPAGESPEVAETTERVRQLFDGIESAVASGHDLELARFLVPPALGLLLAASAAQRARGRSWLPARAGLRWSRSGREPDHPGCFWLLVRFEDRTEVRSEAGVELAPCSWHELELELDTSRVPWRLGRAEELLGG